MGVHLQTMHTQFHRPCFAMDVRNNKSYRIKTSFIFQLFNTTNDITFMILPNVLLKGEKLAFAKMKYLTFI